MSKHYANRITTLYFGFAASGLFWGALAASTPELQRQSGTDNTGFGALLFLMVACALPVIALSAPVIRKLGAAALPLSLVLFALAITALGMADTPYGIALGLMAIGASSGALDAALNVETATLEHHTGTALFHRAHALFPLCLLIASPMTGMARDLGIALWMIFFAIAAVLFVMALFCRGSARATAMQEAPRSAAKPLQFNTLTLGVFGIALLIILSSMIEGVVESWGAIYIETGRGATAVLAGSAAAIFTLGLGLGRMAAHYYDAHFSERAMIVLAGGLVTVGFLVIALAGPIAVVFLGLFIAGAAAGPIEPLVIREVARKAPQGSRHQALCLATCGTYTGLMLSPPVFGWLADTVGWDWTWASGALLGIGTIALAGCLRRKAAAPYQTRRTTTDPTEYPAPKEQITPV